MDILLLASQSKSRKLLLFQSGIKFNPIEQFADELSCSRVGSLSSVVAAIALKKMECAIVPDGQKENQITFIVSADTMGINSEGKICGKPESKEDAISMLRSYKAGVETCTAFCLDKRIWRDGEWKILNRIQKFVTTTYIFDVPENELERYFKLSLDADLDYMNLSGAAAIEEFGGQYLKTLTGSYSAVVGLPMYELRESLVQLGFQF